MSRRPFVAGNWKMHCGAAGAAALVRALEGRLPGAVDVAVCPPFTSLRAALDARPAGLAVYAQNMHWEASGAFTGEVSAPMLVEAGVDGVLVGHSERRALFGETDAAVGRKLAAAHGAGLAAIVAVGETEDERERGATFDVLARQLEAAFAQLSAAQAGATTVAYEPVWAIGTGRTATPELAQEAHAEIRRLLRDRFGDAAGRIRIQYGGSVKPQNARELLGQPDIDGALVGGASLDAGSFAAILAAAA